MFDLRPLEFLGSIGNAPLSIYELLFAAMAITFVTIGSRMTWITLTVPGLAGLAAFAFMTTERHFFPGYTSWPFSIALVGVIAIFIGLVSAYGLGIDRYFGRK